jgi:predicted TIM-barrel fold metal-dependent hydrolase
MGKIVDVDGHVMEPADLWEKNLAPRYRDRALRIRRDAQGAEYFEIAGRKSRVMQGGSLGAFGTLDADVKARWEREQSSNGPDYENHVPAAARDMQARLRWMDAEGIDISLMYPSLCLGWQNECDDPDLALAYCQVYNDWLTDLCSPVSDRIVPIAMIPLLRIEDGVAELRRAADLGAKGLYLNPVPMNGIPYGDPIYDPLWAVCQQRGLPVALHVSNTPLNAGHRFYDSSFGKNYWFMMMMYTPDCQIALTSFFNGGVFERFPRLSVGVLEIGCGWVAHWLETMDARYRLGGHELMKRPPSEYFDRQCWISGETDERTFALMARLVGSHKLMWASDYPHQEGHEHPVTELRERLAELDDRDRDRILGTNAVECYGLA